MVLFFRLKWSDSGLGLSRVAKIGLLDFQSTWESIFCIFGGNGERNDDIFPGLPVGRSSNGVPSSQLQRIQYPEDFLEITAGGGWVGYDKLNFFIGPDDEERSNGEGLRGIRMDHVV